MTAPLPHQHHRTEQCRVCGHLRSMHEKKKGVLYCPRQQHNPAFVFAPRVHPMSGPES